MTFSVPHRRRGAVLAALGCALALAGCGGGKKDKDKGPPKTPEAGFVVLGTRSVPLALTLPGRTAALETSDVRPQVAGVIQARLFREGGIVQQGQTLYQIDPSLYQAAVAQARANLLNARATYGAAKTLADRYLPLARIQAVAQQDLTNAEASAEQARANIAQNEAALQTAEINLRYTRVPAPIGGRIGRSLVTTGALVTAGQTTALAQIQRLDPIFVDIQQSSADLLRLRAMLATGGVTPASATVRLRLEDGSLYPAAGRIEFSESVVDAATGTVTLRARFPNRQGVLLPGMFVRAEFSQAVVQDAVLAPQAAVSRDPVGRATVLLVGADNKAVERRIETERTVGQDWLVKSGLKPGDRVITEGLGRIKPGQRIVPVPAGSPPRRQAAAGGKGGGGPAKGGG